MFFRIYPLDHKGQYGPPIELDAASEAEALDAAAALSDRLNGEFDLWQLSRFLGRYGLEPGGRPVPASNGQAGPDGSA